MGYEQTYGRLMTAVGVTLGLAIGLGGSMAVTACVGSTTKSAMRALADAEPPPPRRAAPPQKDAGTPPPITVAPKNAAELQQAIDEVWRLTDLEIVNARAKAKLDAAVDRAGAAQAARDDMRAQVRRWTAWVTSLLVVALVGGFVASFWGLVSRRDVLGALAGLALTSMVRYALLRWGPMAADVAVWVAIAMLAVAALAVGIPLGVGWFRARAERAARAMVAKGDPAEARAATALFSVASGDVGESPLARARRRSTLAAVRDSIEAATGVNKYNKQPSASRVGPQGGGR